MAQKYDFNNPHMTSAETLLGSIEAAAEQGGTLDESLRFSGITLAQITTGDGYLPLHRVMMFLNHAADVLDCDTFGLLVAKHQPPLRFAMVGQLIRFAPTLGLAIGDAVRFSILNSQYSKWDIHRGERALTFRRHVRVQLDQNVQQMQTLSLALVYKAMNAITQSRVELSQVAFSHSRPADDEKVLAFFDAPVLYDQPYTNMVLMNSELAKPIPTADKEVHTLLQAHLESVVGATTAELDVVDRLRQELRQTVGSRRCTLEGVCQSWGTSPRGLQRRLRERGTSFRELLQDVRQELAESYLRNSSIAVLELSDLLGYRNASAFSRAFKQQTGVAPDYWRSGELSASAVGK